MVQNLHKFKVVQFVMHYSYIKTCFRCMVTHNMTNTKSIIIVGHVYIATIVDSNKSIYCINIHAVVMMRP